MASYRIVAWEATADGHACVRPSSRAAPTGLVVRRAASARDGAPRRGIARRTVHRGGLATRGHRTARTALTGDSRARNISGPGNAGPGAPGYRRNFGILSPKPVKRTSYRSVTVSASIFIWSQPPAPLRGRSENYAIRVYTCLANMQYMPYSLKYRMFLSRSCAIVRAKNSTTGPRQPWMTHP